MPKGFLEMDGIAIVERSVRKLFAAGIEEVVIGTGHCSEYYERLADRYPCVTLAHNPDYASTGSMGTLACCAPYVKHDFLVLESDLVYDDAGLFVLINDPRPNVLLASGKTGSGDEVYLKVRDDRSLLLCSKHIEDVGTSAGELVGITKLTPETLREMVSFYRTQDPKTEYETAMGHVSTNTGNRIYVRTIEHYQWREIDTAEMYEAAKEVYARIKENESLREVRREVLLNPGPATTTDSVKYAQVQADICPREKEFGNVMRWISDQLSLLVAKPGSVETVLFGGSGTAGDEAMVSSCVPDDGKLLIIDNGAYGKRMAKIAGIYGINHEMMSFDECEPIDVPAIEKRIVEGEFTHFAIVYHETTTGILNPVPELCRFCHEHGVMTIVDAVSAFAAVDIDMDRDCIDFMASTSNKNIQGMAGVAFVFCRKEALEAIKGYRMRNYYLNVYDQYAYFQKAGQMRFTPPVQTLYALRQAIIETKNETIRGRYERYSACWRILVDTVQRLGLTMPVPLKCHSRLIVTINDPDSPRYDFEEFHDRARALGFTIYPGKLSAAKTFRIANIGDIRPEEMKRFCAFLEKYIRGLRPGRLDLLAASLCSRRQSL